MTRSTSISASFFAATPAPDSARTSSQTAKRSASNCSSEPGRAARHKSRSKTRQQRAWCCQRYELGAILESTALNDPVQQLRLQSGDKLREVRRRSEIVLGEKSSEPPGACGKTSQLQCADGQRSPGTREYCYRPDGLISGLMNDQWL